MHDRLTCHCSSRGLEVNLPKMRYLGIFVFFCSNLFSSVELGTVTVTDSVGAVVELQCPLSTSRLDPKTTMLKWIYHHRDVCSLNSSDVDVSECENGRWEDLGSEGHHLRGNDSSCVYGVAYMHSSEPGTFTYACEEIDKSGIPTVINTKTFAITITKNTTSRSVKCIAKYAPSQITFRLICVIQQRCLDTGTTENEELLFEYKHGNDTRTVPEINFANKIVSEENIGNISYISRYSCINHNESYACNVDRTENNDYVSITPLVNKFTVGGEARFKCVFSREDSSDLRYTWQFSGNSQLLRRSDTTRATLTIPNLAAIDDETDVTCTVEANGASFMSQAFLKMVPKHTTPSLVTPYTNITSAKSNHTLLTTPSVSTVSLGSPIIIRCVFFVASPIFFSCMVAICIVLSKIRRRRKRFPSQVFDVQESLGSNSQNEQNALPLRSQGSHSSIRRKPSVTSQSASTIASPPTSPVSCPLTIHADIEQSDQQGQHSPEVTYSTSLTSSTCPPAMASQFDSPFYHVLDQESLSMSTFPSLPLSMPRIMTQPNSPVSIDVPKSGTIPYPSVSPCATGDSAALSPKASVQFSFCKSPCLSRARKSSAKDQPLPAIPPMLGGKSDSTERCTPNLQGASIELQAVVTKPMVHEYSGMDQRGIEHDRCFKPDTTGPQNHDSAPAGTAYGRNNSTNPSECSVRGSDYNPDLHAYASVDGDNDYISRMPSSSTYQSIDQEDNVMTSPNDVHHYEESDTTFNATRQADDDPCSDGHIYELPLDDIADDGGDISGSGEAPFYFTLESKDNDNDDVSCQSLVDDTETQEQTLSTQSSTQEPA